MSKYNKLSKADIKLIRTMYEDDNLSREDAQNELASRYNVETRTIRSWAKQLELVNNTSPKTVDAKILIYDIETSRTSAKVWWTGKQYINHAQLRIEPTIISIAWKFLGENKVYSLNWDMTTHSDKEMLVKFAEVYNSADMVIGQNNDQFDNKWVNARCAKHGIFINTFVNSFDLMKQTKRLFRLPSYSMAYVSKYFNVTHKQSHDGIIIWDMIEDGNPSEQKEYMKKMLTYNIGDIVTTEELYLKLRKYMGHKIHVGVLNGDEKWTSPNNGTTNIELFRTNITPAGTVQRVMKCLDTGMLYKLSNREYMNFLDYND